MLRCWTETVLLLGQMSSQDTQLPSAVGLHLRGWGTFIDLAMCLIREVIALHGKGRHEDRRLKDETALVFIGEESKTRYQISYKILRQISSK
jgi:hypothetical protein